MAEKPEGLKEAINIAGGVGKLGEAIGITGEAVSQWTKVPSERVIPIERATGVPRQRLRPDLYPAEGAA